MKAPPLIQVAVQVNDRQQQRSIEPRVLLVHFLREDLAMTGTHVGCDTTQCGACTVLLDGLAVKSCTVLAAHADGCAVQTIEGLGSKETLHPIQQAFIEHHGLQCGFCTPGMIMAVKQLLERYPDPDDETIGQELDGNICRCTGYRNIVIAVKAAAARMRALSKGD